MAACAIDYVLYMGQLNAVGVGTANCEILTGQNLTSLDITLFLNTHLLINLLNETERIILREYHLSRSRHSSIFT